MANECKYKFTDAVPTHEVYKKKEDSNLLVRVKVKGVTPFGVRGGVLTEDKLTDAICEHLLNTKDRVNSDGKPFSLYIELKKSDKSDKSDKK